MTERNTTVDTFAQQVLPETSGLALEHIAQGFERTTILAGDRAAAPPVVEQCIDSLLACVFVTDDLSGALNSMRRFKRLLRLITRR
jgi:hypothetical protein